MSINYATFIDSPLAYGRRARLVVPSDTVDLPKPAKTIVAAIAGTITFLPLDNPTDEPITLPMLEGSHLPFIVRRVLATGTVGTFYTVE